MAFVTVDQFAIKFSEPIDVAALVIGAFGSAGKFDTYEETTKSHIFNELFEVTIRIVVGVE